MFLPHDSRADDANTANAEGVTQSIKLSTAGGHGVVARYRVAGTDALEEDREASKQERAEDKERRLIQSFSYPVSLPLWDSERAKVG